MIHVYVVERHYDYEGSSIEEVYAFEADAIAHGRRTATEYGCEDTEGFSDANYVWRVNYGSMQITVRKFEVKTGGQ